MVEHNNLMRILIWKSTKAIFAVSRAELKRFRTIDGDTVGQIAAEFNHLNIIQHLHEIEPTLLQERNDQGRTFLLAEAVIQWEVTKNA